MVGACPHIFEPVNNVIYIDWVPLNVNGVVRGDIYLEMTFYANTSAGPAPATSLALPVDHALTRRSSKLLPSDRLYRVPQNLAPPTTTSPPAPSKALQHPGYSTPHTGGESTLQPSSAPPKRSESPFPTLPDGKAPNLALPEILIPSGGRTHPKPHDRLSPQIPSMLRPRNEILSPIQADQRPVSLPYPGEVPNSPAYDYGATYSRTNHNTLLANTGPRTPFPPSTTQRTYSPAPNPTPSDYGFTYPRANHDAPRANAAPITPYPLSTTRQSYSPAPGLIPSGPPSRLSFPVPTIAPLQASATAPYPMVDPRPFPNRPSEQNDFPDPYLRARYQTPLPLPPGSTNLKPHSNQTAPQTPLPLPPGSTNLKPHSNQTAPQQTHSDSGSSIIDALRREEEEAWRQKEQEKKDLELALQLDRELNLAT
jgi:hypothetical protein